MNAFDRLSDLLRRIEHAGMLLCLAGMVLLTLLNVLLRGLYTHTGADWANTLMGHVDWSEPLVRLLVLWVTFLASSALTREGNHIRIDIAAGAFGPRSQALRDAILSAAAGLICSLMMFQGVVYIRIEKSYGTTLFLDIPSWVAQIIIPAGFGLMALRFWMRLVQNVMSIWRGGTP